MSSSSAPVLTRGERRLKATKLRQASAIQTRTEARVRCYTRLAARQIESETQPFECLIPSDRTWSTVVQESNDKIWERQIEDGVTEWLRVSEVSPGNWTVSYSKDIDDISHSTETTGL